LHLVWNGLTVADVVFPWFTWMMGVSIVLSQRSLRAKNVRKRMIFLKICRRTFILFGLGNRRNSFVFTNIQNLGLMLQGGYDRWVNIRIFGVLQRLALCYFFAAIIVLVFDDTEDEPYSSEWPIGKFEFEKLSGLFVD
jgi:heparan-alpha-glucosaminide N-acetyltransferase